MTCVTTASPRREAAWYDANAVRTLARSVLAVVALAVAVVVGGPAPPAMACSCVASTDVEAAAASDAVFVATLVAVELPPPAEIMSSDDPATYTFAVTDVLKGDVAERQEVVSEVSGASCGLELPGEDPLLVFATATSSPISPQPGPGQYYASLCGGTRPLQPGEDLAALRPPPAPSPEEPAAPPATTTTTLATVEPVAPPSTTAVVAPPVESVAPPPTTATALVPVEPAATSPVAVVPEENADRTVAAVAASGLAGGVGILAAGALVATRRAAT